MKSSVALLMGVIILIADLSWLIIGGSYTNAPWLVLGIVIFVADIMWLGMDFSLMKEAGNMDVRKEKSASVVKK